MNEMQAGYRFLLYYFSIVFLLQAYTECGFSAEEDSEVIVEKAIEPWKGDLDALNQRRAIRVLVTFNKTNFFFDQGQPRGGSYEVFMELEKYWNEKTQAGALKKHIIFIPVRRDQLLPYLMEGRGDVAASSLTITPQRLEQVDFTDPIVNGIKEIIVTNKDFPPILSIESLSGKTVTVRKSSSFYSSLSRQNELLKASGKLPINIALADENLESEDLLEMVNAGMIPMTVVDDRIAEFWSQTLSDIQLHNETPIRRDGQIAWAVRKDCPKLKAFLNEFIPTVKKGSMLGNIFFKRYVQSIKYAEQAASPANRKRMLELAAVFQNYCDQYHFDWILLAAQAYQESHFDQTLVSSAGAVGIMQVKPSTAQGHPVYIRNVEVLDNNIHAGVKYMAFIRDTYFSDDNVDDLNKQLFCLASYNAGPTRIANLRKKTGTMGLDANKWFQNVEVAAAKDIGRETVQYVSNIFKYYVAYKQIIESGDVQFPQKKKSL